MRQLGIIVVLLLSALISPSVGLGSSSQSVSNRVSPPSFRVATGDYVVKFQASTGTITITPTGKAASLVLRELPGGKKLDLLYSVQVVRHSGSVYRLTGRSSWATFTFLLDVSRAVPGLLHIKLSVRPFRSAPPVTQGAPDVRLMHAAAGSLKLAAPAPPVAGTSLMLWSQPLGSTLLYLADLTSLGPYFDRTNSGATQPNFAYPNAGNKGSLVGMTTDGYFGYVPPPDSTSNLPRGKTTVAIDSYLYLVPGTPDGEVATADDYLQMLGTVYGSLPKPGIPLADWHALAGKQANDLSNAANWVTVNGVKFLRSYVSDTRSSPELITQAGVLAGVKAYENRYHESLPLDAALEQTLPAFYDTEYHTVTNNVGHDPTASGESWYFAQNMISLLQLARLGSANGKALLLQSAPAFMDLAHANNYEFPQNFRYGVWSGQGSGLQADVVGGYAWVMLGLYDLTNDGRYLDEAKAAIAHVAGKGFGLSYETQMTAYAAAAAQRLYMMTHDSAYHGYAQLALANLLHATRLWDCTYGTCRKGTGYHTYFGTNPLPWSDYVAMLEQSQAWFALRDYRSFAQDEPSSITQLVDGYLHFTPLTMQFALPPRLPKGAATSVPTEYANVHTNRLDWYIPIEDLREGEAINGVIGQEIYGAGGPFLFAAGAG